MTPVIEIRRHHPSHPWTYARLDQRQRTIAKQARDEKPGALLLSEVAPVITLGRRAGPSELTSQPEFLKKRGIELYPTDRGGLATYHGPGQWVLFAVDRLDRLVGDPRGVRKAVEGLLEIALQVGRKYDPTAEIRRGCELGVWTEKGKFAAVGIHIEQRVVLHGLSFNGFSTPQSFVGLRPCGLDAPVDYLLQSLSEEARQEAFDRLGSELLDAALATYWR